jgi:Domain of unknown function (DUF397)
MERIDRPRWRKSTYSGSNGGDCIEGDGAVLRFSSAAWRELITRVKDH